MRWTSRRSEILLLALALPLPFKAAGCGGRTACFTTTPAQLDNGACPGTDVATMRLVNSNTCGGGSIASVDGPGYLDGQLCCYPVTYANTGNNSLVDPIPCEFPGGPGGFGTTTGVTGFGGTGGTTTSCASCNDALVNGAPFGNVCNPTVLADLRVCACANKCTDACDPTLCAGNEPDTVCTSCMQSQCGTQLAVCQQN